MALSMIFLCESRTADIGRLERSLKARQNWRKWKLCLTFFKFSRQQEEVPKLAVIRANADQVQARSGLLSRAQSQVSLAHPQLRLKQQQLRSKDGSGN